MDFDQIFNDLKTELLALLKSEYDEFFNTSKNDINKFIRETEEKLKRWTILLADGDITPDEFAWLVKSQKDMFLLQSLQSAGMSKLRLSHLRNKLINTVIETLLRAALI